MKRRILIALDLFTALGAVVGAAAMFADPEGSPIGMPLALLERTPFGDFRFPGLLLLFSNGLLPLLAVAGLHRGARWGVAMQLIAAAVLLGWMGGQLALLGLIAFFQPLMLMVGALLMRLAMDESHPLRATG